MGSHRGVGTPLILKKRGGAPHIHIEKTDTLIEQSNTLTL